MALPCPYLLAPLAAVLLAVLIVIGYCSIIFRRTRRISPVAALRGLKLATPPARGLNARPSLLGVHTWFGLARLRVNRSSALTLLVVLALAISIAVTPLKLHSTLSAPNFITYMGIGQSDLRVDATAQSTTRAELTRATQHLETSSDVTAYTLRQSALFELTTASGETENA